MLKKVATFLLCLLPPFTCALTGAFFRPGVWYTSLVRPSWTPPNFLFPIAWTLLYFLMGVTLYKLWERYRLKGKESFLYGMQFVFNGSWSPLFFGAHEIGKGLIVLGALWFTLLTFLFLVRKQKDLFILNVPYFLWVSFAFALNGAIFHLNPDFPNVITY